MHRTLRGRSRALSFNLFPAYRGTGGRITYIANDWREVHVKLARSWRTHNYRGTLFGGSLYGAIDPIDRNMLIKNLGPEYSVWDKSATIHFRKPRTGTLTTRFLLEAPELDTIRDLAASGAPLDRVYTVNLANRQGVICASVEKTIYIRRRKSKIATAEKGYAQAAVATS